MDPDITQELERLEELSAEELATLETSLVEAAEAVDEESDEGLDDLASIRDAVVRVRERRAEIEAQAAERAERREKLLSEIDPPEEEAVTEEAAEDAVEEATQEPEPKVEAEAEPVPVAAAVLVPMSAPMPRPPARRQRITRADEPHLVITAAADVPRFSAGQEIPDIRSLGETFWRKAELALGSRSRNVSRKRSRESSPAMSFPVATFEFGDAWPDERRLGEDIGRNTERIRAVTAPQALTAAGGLCAPVTPRYELPSFSVTNRPVRDCLPSFNATRGGVQVPTPFRPSDAASGVDVITEAEDTSGTTKPCVTIPCPAFTEVDVSAISGCVQIGNFNRRFFPESFDGFWQELLAQHAREAEQELLARMESLSTLVTTGEIAGAARDILENLAQAGAQQRNRLRTGCETTLRWVAPCWVRDLMAADLIRQHPGDMTLGVTVAMIDAMIRARNIEPCWSLDYQPFGTQVAAALLAWPGTFDSLLFAEGSFLHLDGGTLDFGMEIRDPTLNEQNNVRAMFEIFENVAFVGVESLRLRMNICPDGSSAATKTLAVCVTGS